MIQALYKYVFRGIGIALLIGMLTILYLKINSVIEHGAPQAPDASERPINGGRR